MMAKPADWLNVKPQWGNHFIRNGWAAEPPTASLPILMNRCLPFWLTFSQSNRYANSQLSCQGISLNQLSIGNNKKALAFQRRLLKWDWRDSNPRPLPCQGNALNQLSYSLVNSNANKGRIGDRLKEVWVELFTIKEMTFSVYILNLLNDTTL